ncbi:hypothetical protein TL16_g10315 [Triparma laevis f. inornata]|uniref:Uncharacterized protein n=1 Tax=Triparma laevis f. inornata TaxID=1714386 RepID=A0A9W7ENI6_9STRA|nr:hypothetical protein TL16_g10315 [Triparma laevis f. inornata]
MTLPSGHTIDKTVSSPKSSLRQRLLNPPPPSTPSLTYHAPPKQASSSRPHTGGIFDSVSGISSTTKMVSPVKKQTIMKPSTASHVMSTTGGATVQRRPVSSVEDYRKAREMFGDMLSVKQEPFNADPSIRSRLTPNPFSPANRSVRNPRSIYTQAARTLRTTSDPAPRPTTVAGPSIAFNPNTITPSTELANTVQPTFRPRTALTPRVTPPPRHPVPQTQGLRLHNPLRQRPLTSSSHRPQPTSPSPKTFTFAIPLHYFKNTPRHNPYNLLTSPTITPSYASSLSEFAVISDTGVTYYKDGNPDFCSKRTWSRHKIIFSKICAMKCFGNVKLRIYFRKYKQYYTSRKRNRISLHLQHNLLFLSPSFSSGLQKIRHLLHNLGLVNMIDFGDDMIGEDEFKEAGKRERGRVRRIVEEGVERVAYFVAVVCKEEMIAEELLVSSPQIPTTSPSHYPTSSPEPSSIRGQNIPLPWSVSARQRSTCSKFLKLFHLIQYMLHSTFRDIVLNHMSRLVNFVKPRGNVGMVKSSINISIEEKIKNDFEVEFQDIDLSSDVEDIEEQILMPSPGIIEWIDMIVLANMSVIFMLSKVRPLKKHPKIKPFVKMYENKFDDDDFSSDDSSSDDDDSEDDKPLLPEYTEQNSRDLLNSPWAQTLINEDTEYISLAQSIIKGSTECYENMMEYVGERYEEVVGVWKESRVWDLEGSVCDRLKMSSTQDTTENSTSSINDLTWLDAIVSRHYANKEIIQSLPRQTPHNIFMIQNFELKNTLLEGPESCLMSLKVTLPEFFVDFGSEVLEKLGDVSRDISSICTNVREYVHQLKTLKNHEDGLENLTEEVEKVSSFYNFLKKNYIISGNKRSYEGIPASTLLHGQILDCLSHYRVGFSQCQGEMDGLMTRFRLELKDDHLKNLKAEIKRLQRLTSNPIFKSFKSDHTQVLKFLSTIDYTRNKIASDIKEFEDMQDVMLDTCKRRYLTDSGSEIVRYNFIEFVKMSEDINHMIELWSIVNTVKELEEVLEGTAVNVYNSEKFDGVFKLLEGRIEELKRSVDVKSNEVFRSACETGTFLVQFFAFA